MGCVKKEDYLKEELRFFVEHRKKISEDKFWHIFGKLSLELSKITGREETLKYIQKLCEQSAS